MASREEIREGVDAILEAGDMFLNPPDDLAEFIDKGAIKQGRTEQILSYLHSQGVVIRVDKMVFDEPAEDGSHTIHTTYEPLIKGTE